MRRQISVLLGTVKSQDNSFAMGSCTWTQPTRLALQLFRAFAVALSLISKAWKASIPAQGNGWFQAAATMSRYPSNVTQMFSNRKLLKCGRAQSVRGSKGTWSEHSEESATGRGSERQPANHQKQETDQASRVWGCPLAGPSVATSFQVKLLEVHIVNKATKATHHTQIETNIAFICRPVNQVEITTNHQHPRARLPHHTQLLEECYFVPVVALRSVLCRHW